VLCRSFIKKSMRSLIMVVFEVALALGFVVSGRPTNQVAGAQTLTTRAWRVLNVGLSSKKFAERIVVLKAIGDLGPNLRGIGLVAELLKDKDPEVRAQAAATLGEMNSRAAIPYLGKALDDPAPQVSFAAATSLWKLRDYRGEDLLIEVLEGQQGTKGNFVAGKIRGMKHELQDKKALIGMGTAKGASELLPFPLSLGVGLAKGGMSPGADLARADSATLLARHVNSKVMEALNLALADDDWTVRAAAARAIGRTARPSTAKWLEPLLDDEKPGVRYEAAVAIIRVAYSKS
jgi:hypothetical protein